VPGVWVSGVGARVCWGGSGAAEARPEGMIAPAGECEYCDRRRAYAAGAMRSLRAKRKEGG
jgi:hypothetical protein